MKKALFIMKYLIGDNRDNLYTKFSGQIKAVENLGYDVWYTGIENKEIFLCNKTKKTKIGDINPASDGIKAFHQISFYDNFYKAIYHYLEGQNAIFDFSYIRSMFFCPNSLRLLKQLSKPNTKVVMEIPTHPAKNEYKRNSNLLLKYALLSQHELTKLHSKYVDLYAVIGETCNGTYFGKKAINIENGIQIDSVPPKVKLANSGKVHILALATMAKWHGYDRLIKGMYDYYKNGGKEEVILHMVGNDGDGSLENWKQLVYDLNLDNRVFFEGFLVKESLNNIFNLCDIAISSLAGYRIGVYNTIEMKSREYMARGIPFVYSTQDEVLENATRFCYKVENRGLNVNISDIIGFAHTVQKDNNIVNDMRKYAEDNMSWENQFIKIIRIIGENNAHSNDSLE